MADIPDQILILEPASGESLYLEKFLALNPYYKSRVVKVKLLNDALKLIRDENFKCFLTELVLPDSGDPQVTLKKLHPCFRKVPTVIVTGVSDFDLPITALKLGVQAYLRKDELSPSLLNRTVLFAAEQFSLMNAVRDMALVDVLTGLYNKNGFFKLGRVQHDLFIRKGMDFFVSFIDLNKMKHINDHYGHNMGDAAIIETSKLIRSVLRSSDLASRWGGDEFCIIGAGKEPEVVKHRIDSLVANFNSEKKLPFEISLSMGSAVSLSGVKLSLDQLVNQADENMYTLKQQRAAAIKAAV